jgi:signal peptidase I
MTSQSAAPPPSGPNPAAPPPAGAPKASGAPPEQKKETWGSFLRFLAVLFLATLFVRSCVVAPFSIPSGSMLPNLVIGDYLFVSKWPYGYSRYSFPFGVVQFDGRVMGSLPHAATSPCSAIRGRVTRIS